MHISCSVSKAPSMSAVPVSVKPLGDKPKDSHRQISITNWETNMLKICRRLAVATEEERQAIAARQF